MADEDHSRVEAHETKRGIEEKWLLVLVSEASPSDLFNAYWRRGEMCLVKSAMSNSS